MSSILWSSVSGDPTHNGDWADIPGLSVEVRSVPSATRALLIFNLPQPYAEGSDFPGALVRILFDGQPVVEGCFTYSQRRPESFGRMPLTLTARVAVSPGAHRVVVQWASVRGSNVHLGGSASLAAMFEIFGVT